MWFRKVAQARIPLFCRQFYVHESTVAAPQCPVDSSLADGSMEYSSAKPFKEIPGPVPLPILGNLLMYRFDSVFDVEEYPKVLQVFYTSFGDLVKEEVGMRTVLHVFNPDDARTVLNADGKMPHINPLQETTQIYRKMRSISPGLGNMNGPDWYRLRLAVQQLMMRPQEVQRFLPLTETVANAFVSYITTHKDSTSNEVPDFRNVVLKWSLESSGYIVFEKRLNLLSEDPEKSQLAQKMIDANQEIFRLSGRLKFSVPIFKYIITPKWYRLVKAEDFFYGEATKFVNETVDTIRKLKSEKKLEDSQYTFMKYLLDSKDLDDKDVTIIALSLFGDGLNTTAPALIYNLYCLATHPEVQERLRDEIYERVSDTGLLSEETLKNMPYLKACIKEASRLYPVGSEISRVTQKDLVLSGYQVPAGTAVDINMIVHFREQKTFPEPCRFMPERWLRGDSGAAASVNPFLLLPFGHGLRMCAGRRFAEQDLYVVLIRLLQRFRIRHYHGDLEQEMHTLLLPKGSCQFAFEPLPSRS